jgi:hypothetical protein
MRINGNELHIQDRKYKLSILSGVAISEPQNIVESHVWGGGGGGFNGTIAPINIHSSNTTTSTFWIRSKNNRDYSVTTVNEPISVIPEQHIHVLYAQLNKNIYPIAIQNSNANTLTFLRALNDLVPYHNIIHLLLPAIISIVLCVFLQSWLGIQWSEWTEKGIKKFLFHFFWFSVVAALIWAFLAEQVFKPIVAGIQSEERKFVRTLISEYLSKNHS